MGHKSVGRWYPEKRQNKMGDWCQSCDDVNPDGTVRICEYCMEITEKCMGNPHKCVKNLYKQAAIEKR